MSTIRWVVFLVPVMALGALLVLFKFIGFADILRSLQNLRSPSIALILAIWVAGLMIHSFKLKVVCRSVSHIRFRDAVLVYLGGNFVSTITPGYQIAGEPVRAFYLSTLYPNGNASYMILVLLDRFFNLVAIIFYALVALALFFLQYSLNLEKMVSVAVSLAVVLLLVVLVVTFKSAFSALVTYTVLWAAYFVPFSPLRKKYLDKEAFARVVKEQSTVVVNTLLSTMQAKGIGSTAFALAMLGGITDYLRLYVIFKFMGHNVSLSVVFIAFTFTEVAARAVGFIPGGIGITEASLMGFFGVLNVRPEFAAAAVVVERSLFYGINIGLGYLALVVLHWRLGYRILSTQTESRILRSDQD